MKVTWSTKSWDDYVDWQSEDKKIVKRINQLIADIQRNGYTGIGKPEPLRYGLSGWWSRRINEKHRLVYRIEGGGIEIAECKDHY